MSDTAAAHEAQGHHQPLGFIRTYIFSLDHKMIGRQFLFQGLFMIVVGALLAMLVRWQLAWPETRGAGLGLYSRTLYLSWTQRRRHYSATDL